MNNSIKNATEAFKHFFEVIQTLRAPGGCPWDREQTPLSMRRDLMEETFEAVDAITAQDAEHSKEELGDVLLNATMIAYMNEQEGNFCVADMINELTKKLIRRHPHVFAQSEGSVESKGEVISSEQVLNQWERIKENVEGRKTSSILDEVPKGFPPLLKAFKMQKKAAKKGFDWKDSNSVVEKVREELAEVCEAKVQLDSVLNNIKNKKDFESESHKKIEPFTTKSCKQIDEAQLHLEEEVGDLLFAVVNYARKMGIDPETALNRTNKKFYERFSYVEQQMQKNNIPMDETHFKEQDSFWDEAKKLEN